MIDGISFFVWILFLSAVILLALKLGESEKK